MLANKNPISTHHSTVVNYRSLCVMELLLDIDIDIAQENGQALHISVAARWLLVLVSHRTPGTLAWLQENLAGSQ